MAPVEFDNDVSFETDKVNNRLVDGLLSSEFQPIKLARSQMLPKQPFGIR
jgi:hypothetical protein